MVPVWDMPVLLLLLLKPMLRLMLVFSMEAMAMVPVWDMLDLDIPVLDMLDMVVMDLDIEDTVLDMDVPSMVKQLIYASKSSKVLFNYSVPSLGVGFLMSYSDRRNVYRIKKKSLLKKNG